MEVFGTSTARAVFDDDPRVRADLPHQFSGLLSTASRTLRPSIIQMPLAGSGTASPWRFNSAGAHARQMGDDDETRRSARARLWAALRNTDLFVTPRDIVNDPGDRCPDGT